MGSHAHCQSSYRLKKLFFFFFPNWTETRLTCLSGALWNAASASEPPRRPSCHTGGRDALVLTEPSSTQVLCLSIKRLSGITMLEIHAMWSHPVRFVYRVVTLYCLGCAFSQSVCSQELLYFKWRPQSRLGFMQPVAYAVNVVIRWRITLLPGSLRLTHIYELFILLCNLVASPHRAA